MSERVSLSAAGKQLGVSGGDIRRARYTKVTTARPGAWEHEPAVWLRKAQARKRWSARTAGFFGGCTYRVAAAEERASIARAAALAWAAFLNAPGEPGPDG